jgi:hypothetical protein
MRSRRRVRPLTMDELLESIRREYRALPGLRLTEDQICRIWALERADCRRLMRALVDSRDLRCEPDGRYVRAELRPPAGPRPGDRRSPGRERGTA